MTRSSVQVLWYARWFLAVFSVLGAAGALTYAFLSTEIYRAEALVQPRQDMRAGGMLGALDLQMNELPWFLGGNTGDRGVAIATLKSRTVIEPLLNEWRLLPKLYPGQWDSRASSWKDSSKAPTIWQGYNDFVRSVLRIGEDRRTGLVTVAVEWKEPVEAQKMVKELIAKANVYLQMKAIEEGERHLRYLEEQSKTIGQVELRQALFNLEEAELKNVMLAKGSDEYAIKTIDPAVVPYKRIRPKRFQLLLFGSFGGLFIGCVLVLLREAWLSALS